MSVRFYEVCDSTQSCRASRSEEMRRLLYAVGKVGKSKAEQSEPSIAAIQSQFHRSGHKKCKSVGLTRQKAKAKSPTPALLSLVKHESRRSSSWL